MNQIEQLLAWAHGRYEAEVEHRPDVNIHKRTLAETWNQVIRKLESELPQQSQTEVAP